MSRVIRCRAARRALLLGALAAAGCAPADTAPDGESPLDRPADTLVGADTSVGAARGDTVTPLTPVTPVAPLTPVVPVDTTRPALPTTGLPIRLPRDTVRAVAVVHGRAELEVDAKTYMPADYLLVRLLAGRTTVAETWTTRRGDFFFENVRAGTYELQFLKSAKEPRPVYRVRVTVQSDEKVAVPVVHIPIDSIK